MDRLMSVLEKATLIIGAVGCFTLSGFWLLAFGIVPYTIGVELLFPGPPEPLPLPVVFCCGLIGFGTLVMGIWFILMVLR